MLKAVMFDLDGTLVYQTEAYIRDIIGRTLAKLGMPMDEKFAFDLWHGRGGDRHETIRKRLGLQDVMAFWNAFYSLEDPVVRAQHTEAFNDIAVLKALAEKGLKLGLVTSSFDDIARLEMQKLGSHSFDSIITNKRGAGMKLKPAPDPLLLGLKQLGLAPHEAIYVGDSDVDVLASVRAGIRPVVVSRDSSFQGNGHPVTVVKSLHELLEIV